MLNAQSKTITGAALLLGGASFLSRIVGVLRDRILADSFGADRALDIYVAAFRIPDFIYNLIIVGALSAGFIPLFCELFKAEKEKAWKFTNTVLTITFLSTSFLSLILFFLLPQLSHLLFPTFSSSELTQTITLTRIMLLSPVILGVSAVVSSVLQSLRSFFLYSLAPIFYNLGIILGAIFLVPTFGLIGLGYGVIIGAFLHLAVQLPVLFTSGYRFGVSFRYKDASIIRLFRTMIPRTITLATVQITTLFVTSFASLLGAGSIAIFNFANNISSLPVGIIGISFALAAFPTLSEYAQTKNTEEFKKHLAFTTRQIFFFIIPFTVLFILLRAQIVRVLLGSGKFDWTDTIHTANMVGILAISLFAQCLIPLLSRAFYAFHNTKTPLVIALLSMTVTFLASFTLNRHFGLLGLGVGITLGYILQALLLFFALRKKIGHVDHTLTTSLLKIILAALCMSIVTQLLKAPIAQFVPMDKFWGILTQGMVAGGAGILVYGLICYALKLHEMMVLSQSFQKRWLRIKKGEVEGKLDV